MRIADITGKIVSTQFQGQNIDLNLLKRHKSTRIVYTLVKIFL